MKTRILAFLFAAQMTCLSAQNKAVFTVQADKPTAKIASTMWGAFFEDINFGADGGLYAELVKNRSFEFANPMTGWTIHNSKIFYGFNLGSDILIQNRPEKESTNPRYMHVNLNNTYKDSLGLTNEGFHGMGIKKGLRYDFSVMYRQTTANAKLNVQLVNEKGEVIGSGTLTPEVADNGWHKTEMSFTATATVLKAKLNIWFGGKGAIDLDVISLFPTDTWKGRKGGLRADMVQILADMKPGFIRFPGGCIVEGRDLAKRYQWKKTIGPIEDRKLIINRWNDEVAGRPAPDYYQSFGLGFFEYFQLAEDIGAQPLPILNCGMACQFNAAEMVTMDNLDPYVQDALDLIEFANGSVDTKWGKIRADLGHPASFHLKVLGIGNENWGSQYIERLKVFQQAIKAKYPDIKLVTSSGLVILGEAYEYTNQELRKLKVGYVDEHYYNNSQWFLDNAKRYDTYDRKSETKVFVGEYAAQSEQMGSQNNKNNWRTALSEAAYMTGLERNADIVEMAGYAPLFAHVEGWQWKPDLIWVDNLHVMGTPNYYVQKLYASNRGNEVVPMLNNNQPATGQDGLYASSTIDKVTNEVIIKIANVKEKAQSTEVIINGVNKIDSKARLTTLQNDNLEAENSLDSPLVVAPTEKMITTKGKTIIVELKGNSFSVIRVKI
jgi:alpha-N-arabinofuranosidase